MSNLCTKHKGARGIFIARSKPSETSRHCSSELLQMTEADRGVSLDTEIRSGCLGLLNPVLDEAPGISLIRSQPTGLETAVSKFHRFIWNQWRPLWYS